MTMRPESPAEELTKSVPLDVTATQHGDGRSSWYELALEQGGHGDRAAWLDDELHSVQQQPHGVPQRVVVDGDDVVQILLMVCKRHMSDLNSEKPIGESTAVL